MKLIFCPHCHDVLKMRREKRTCDCGKSWSFYETNRRAKIGGAAIPLGIDNRSLVDALESRPEDGEGACFAAFVIPKESPNIIDTGYGPTLKFKGSKFKTVELMLTLMAERS